MSPCFQLAFDLVFIQGIQQDFEGPGSIKRHSNPLAYYSGGVHNIVQECLMDVRESASSRTRLLAVDGRSFRNNSALGDDDHWHSDLALEFRKHGIRDSLISGEGAVRNSDEDVLAGFVLIYVVHLVSGEDEDASKGFLLIRGTALLQVKEHLRHCLFSLVQLLLLVRRVSLCSS